MLSFPLAALANTVEKVDPATVSALPIGRVFFWIFGLMVVAGAAVTVTRRNNISAVMSLVGTFFGLAATYALLQAHFLAALQVLVYAGAIMVLFTFVVMVLNRDEAEPWAFRGVFSKLVIGVPALGYLVARIGSYFGEATKNEVGEASSPTFGTVAEVGKVLFTDYLFAFEAVSVLLLIAVIAAVVVARTLRPDHAYEDPPPEPATDSEGHLLNAPPSGAHAEGHH